MRIECATLRGRSRPAPLHRRAPPLHRRRSRPLQPRYQVLLPGRVLEPSPQTRTARVLGPKTIRGRLVEMAGPFPGGGRGEESLPTQPRQVEARPGGIRRSCNRRSFRRIPHRPPQPRSRGKEVGGLPSTMDIPRRVAATPERGRAPETGTEPGHTSRKATQAPRAENRGLAARGCLTAPACTQPRSGGGTPRPDCVAQFTVGPSR